MVEDIAKLVESFAREKELKIPLFVVTVFFGYTWLLKVLFFDKSKNKDDYERIRELEAENRLLRKRDRSKK